MSRSNRAAPKPTIGDKIQQTSLDATVFLLMTRDWGWGLQQFIDRMDEMWDD